MATYGRIVTAIGRLAGRCLACMGRSFEPSQVVLYFCTDHHPGRRGVSESRTDRDSHSCPILAYYQISQIHHATVAAPTKRGKEVKRIMISVISDYLLVGNAVNEMLRKNSQKTYPKFDSHTHFVLVFSGAVSKNHHFIGLKIIFELTRQIQPDVLEQDFLMLRRSGDAAFAVTVHE